MSNVTISNIQIHFVAEWEERCGIQFGEPDWFLIKNVTVPGLSTGLQDWAYAPPTNRLYYTSRTMFVSEIDLSNPVLGTTSPFSSPIAAEACSPFWTPNLPNLFYIGTCWGAGTVWYFNLSDVPLGTPTRLFGGSAYAVGDQDPYINDVLPASWNGSIGVPGQFLISDVDPATPGILFSNPLPPPNVQGYSGLENIFRATIGPDCVVKLERNPARVEEIMRDSTRVTKHTWTEPELQRPDDLVWDDHTGTWLVRFERMWLRYDRNFQSIISR